MKNGWRWGLVTNVIVSDLQQDWRRRLSQYTHIYVGYSGGLDSTVLLSLVAKCPELHNKITAIHVHHGLSPAADQWLEHGHAYCQQLQVAYQGVRVQVEPGSNLEERARIARYQVFEDCLEDQDVLLLAHHQNDQTETVLLNLLRGAGLDGLCAMPEQRTCGKGILLRPLLHFPRQVLYDYACQSDLHWVEDDMNTANEWSRVYLRQEIIPLLQVKWPNLVGNIASCAQHCQQARQGLDAWMALVAPDLTQNYLDITPDLVTEKVRCTHLLRAWLKHHLHRPPSKSGIEEILKNVMSASQDAMPCVKIEQYTVRRYQDRLYLLAMNLKQPKNVVWENFPQPIAWCDDWFVVATPDPLHGVAIPTHSRIELKIRAGGESLHWHSQTQSLKKLFQIWKMPPWQRLRWPLVYVNDEFMCVPDYAQSDCPLSEDPSERYTITTYQQ